MKYIFHAPAARDDEVDLRQLLSMDITEGHLAAWAATARALEQVEPAEVGFVPEIADSAVQRWGAHSGCTGRLRFRLGCGANNGGYSVSARACSDEFRSTETV